MLLLVLDQPGDKRHGRDPVEGLVGDPVEGLVDAVTAPQL
jgi:hypothetical protein